jgi:Kef-type K+ transport system membrane component KefB
MSAWMSALEVAASDGSGVPGTLIALAVILVVAKVGGELAIRLGQPAVLGELTAGIVLGNLGLVGLHATDFMRGDPFLAMLAELGVVLLLFEVGLTSTIGEMAKVGGRALLVALIGVVTPFALGWGASALMLRGAPGYLHVFIGAALTATSVGITARVLRDLGRAQSPEARIILGAAVIDDVLGLLVLAAVTGVIDSAGGARMSVGGIALVAAKAAAFLVAAVLVGVLLGPRLFRLAARLRGPGVLLPSALVLCFLFAAASGLAGLAPIVGAFAAGLVLEPLHLERLQQREQQTLEDLLRPLTSLLVPVFFVRMGMQVDLGELASLSALALSGLLVVAAVAGKQACSLAVPRGLDRVSVGIGMVPRGEVGLIFADVGLSTSIGGLPLLDRGVFGALVIVIIVTTLIAPPALEWSLSRRPAVRA